nr:hypothetical protein [Tanacetum cinerariifolium]
VTKISQASGPTNLEASKTVYKEWEDKKKRTATTASSLEAKQDSGNINRTQSMATLNEPLPQRTGLVQAHKPTVSSSVDKGKAKMIESKKPLKKKNQIALDEEVARKLETEIRAEMEEEERIAREKDEANRAKNQIALDEEVARKLETEMRAEMEEEERIAREKDEANRAAIEEWDDVQATVDADRKLAKQIQAQEKEQLSIQERSKLLAE